MKPKRRQKVVVVGGGPDGLVAARSCANVPIEAVLIDTSIRTTPLAPARWTIRAAPNPCDFRQPMRSIHAGRADVEVVLGEIEEVDPRSRTIALRGGPTLDYDRLVIVAGLPMWSEAQEGGGSRFGFEDVRSAARLVDRLVRAVECVEAARDKAEASGGLAFVVVGAERTAPITRRPSVGKRRGARGSRVVHHVHTGPIGAWSSDAGSTGSWRFATAVHARRW